MDERKLYSLFEDDHDEHKNHNPYAISSLLNYNNCVLEDLSFDPSFYMMSLTDCLHNSIDHNSLEKAAFGFSTTSAEFSSSELMISPPISRVNNGFNVNLNSPASSNSTEADHDEDSGKIIRREDKEEEDVGESSKQS